MLPKFCCWSRADAEPGLVWVHHRVWVQDREGVFHFPPPTAQRIEGRKREREERAKERKSPSQRQCSALLAVADPSFLLPPH